MGPFGLMRREMLRRPLGMILSLAAVAVAVATPVLVVMISLGVADKVERTADYVRGQTELIGWQTQKETDDIVWDMQEETDRINWLIVAFLFSLVLSVPGYVYGKILRCPLGWREVRNLSDYALTPVVVLILCCHWLGLGFSRLQPVFFLAYTLFLFGAIQVFRIPPEVSPDA